MLCTTLKWVGPHELSILDDAKVPERPGVYVFTEYHTLPYPNKTRPTPNHPNYVKMIEESRVTPCLLYIGKAANLRKRFKGYRLRWPLNARKQKGQDTNYRANRHKGRALLHAHQFFDKPIYLWWTESNSPKELESSLIKEMHPVLNTKEVIFFDQD